MKKRCLSRKARAAMSRSGHEIGSSNLAGWRAKHDSRARALEQEIDAFREKMLAECGPNRSATRMALVEACVVTYASIQRLEHSVVNGPRNKLIDVTERVSWLTSNLSRLLKQLGLDTRSRPRSLTEVFARKGAANAPKAVESRGNPS